MAKENTEQNAQIQRRLDDHEHRIGDMEMRTDGVVGPHRSDRRPGIQWPK